MIGLGPLIRTRFANTLSSLDREVFHIFDSELFIDKVEQKKIKSFLQLWSSSLISRSLSVLISFAIDCN